MAGRRTLVMLAYLAAALLAATAAWYAVQLFDAVRSVGPTIDLASRLGDGVFVVLWDHTTPLELLAPLPALVAFGLWLIRARRLGVVDARSGRLVALGRWVLAAGLASSLVLAVASLGLVVLRRGTAPAG